MTDLKSQILSEVEEQVGSGAVMVMAECFEKCPTLKEIIDSDQKMYDELTEFDKRNK